MQVQLDLQPVLTVLAWAVGPAAAAGVIWKARRLASQMRLSVAAFALALLAITGWAGTKFHLANLFDAECASYVRSAAKATDRAVADKHFMHAVDWLKANGMTEGFTSVLYNGPEEDVSEWFAKLNSVADSRLALQKIDATRCLVMAGNPSLPGGLSSVNTPLPNDLAERLTKIGLLEQAKNKEGGPVAGEYNLVVPAGLSQHPYNTKLFMGGIAAIAFAVVSGFWLLRNVVKHVA